MGILSRPRFLPQQRLDLEDVNALLAALRTDSKLYTKQFLSSTNLIYKGFTVTGIGLKSATVNMADATLIIPQNSNDFSWFTSSPTEPNVTIPDADLTDGTRNYVEIELATENNTPLTKAFWDPEANSGLGSEFNQIVETITDLKTNFVVSTGGFSGSPDRLPLCIIDVDGSGNIKTILDRRNLFGRLAKPADIDNNFTWGTKLEPAYALTMTGVVGTFVAGETIQINTETAKVTTGGTAAIAFNVPSGVNFFPGSTVTGLTSGATGTVNTVAESFTGVDKNLKCQKDINDALMTEMKLVKGTRFWWEDPASSIVGIVKFLESILVQNTATAAFAWDGTNLSITDENVSPGNDVLGYIRIMGRGDDLALTREDGTGGTSTIAIADGEVLFVKIPATGSRTFSGTGSGDTNFQLVDIASYVSSDETYWLAYREGSRLYIRGYGEMEPGEEVNIGDPELEDILASIAANLASANQDRTLKLVEGGTWSLNLDGDELTLSADAFIQIPGLLNVRNRIAAQTISMPNADSVAYVAINRSGVTPAALTVLVADNDAITLGNDHVVIARRTTDGVLVGAHSFLLQPGELLTLDGALAEINKYMGQLKIKRHETDLDKARINPADALLLNGTTLSQVIGNFLLQFTGAVIDFTTGDIFEADGTTPLGAPFTPQVIPSGEYFWYGISLLPGDVNVQNMQEATVQVDLADASDAVQADAPKPVISGTIKLGAILVRNNGGNIEVVDLKPLGVGSGSGGGSGQGASFDAELRTYLKLSDYEFVEANLFPVDEDDKIDPASTGAYSPATRNFEMANGQTMVSADLLDPDFVAANRPLAKARIILRYAEGMVDTNPTVEIKKNGGAYQAVTMNRIGNTDTYDGEITLDAANGTALQMRVTASMDSEIFGYGVMYDTTFVAIPIGQQKNIHPETFLGDLNKTTFTLPFMPDPASLVVYDKTRGQSYIYDPANTFSISGNDIIFVADFFNFPGETIKLEFRQIVGNGFDNSDQNANTLATQGQNLLDIGDELDSQNLASVVLPKMVAPFSTVENRSLVPDMTQDLMPRFGVETFPLLSCHLIMNEWGSSGEPVFGVVNDKFNRVRLVGYWRDINELFGTRVVSAVANDYAEITFCGTGLNAMIEVGTPATDIRASVDGGVEFSVTSAIDQDALTSRKYKPNNLWSVVSGLSYGMHTVKLRVVTIGSYNFNFHGFQVLNESDTGLIRLTPGSQIVKGSKRTNGSLQTSAYNSGFESGVLGTRGGRVLIYQKSDGSVAKSLTPTDASALFLSSANHGNEEPFMPKNFREFGVNGATLDFSSIEGLGATTRTFTLDDASTTLNMITNSSGGLGFVGGQSVPEGLQAAGAGNFIMKTFVGTGLDILAVGDGTTRGYDVIIDGSSVGSFTISKAAQIVKIASGLPYGTHTVKFVQGVPSTCGISMFIPYRPKTPTLPANAVALGAYNIVADYSSTGVAGNAVADNADMWQGVIYKSMTRENLYGGTGWTLPGLGSSHPHLPGGLYANTATNSDWVEHRFFGTGVACHLIDSAGGTCTFTAAIDGVANAGAVNLLSVTNNGAGSYTVNTTTGFLPARLVFTGLTLGWHVIRLTRTAGAGNFAPAGFADISPIHSQSDFGPIMYQNCSAMGYAGIEDLRTFGVKDVPLVNPRLSVHGISSSFSTSSTTYVPTPDMAGPLDIKEDGDYVIEISITHHNSATFSTFLGLFVDGRLYLKEASQQEQNSTYANHTHFSITMFLKKGRHHFMSVIRTQSGGSASVNTNDREMTVRKAT